MSSKIVSGYDRFLTAWVSQVIFGIPDRFCLNTSRSIGVEIDGRLVCAVVYSDYQTKINGDPHSIEMSIGSIDKRWCTRHNLNEFFCYPFKQLKLPRVQTFCSATDQGIIMFNKRLGFVQEGYHREAWPTGGDGISWSMLKDECGWING